MAIDKQKAAISSVFAAVFLTSMKLIVGIFTGSLGILSEAMHSALDLVAAVVTFLAVKFSDKPADSKHHYGHGKIESFSALIETILLFITCGWIIYEAVEKLFFGKSVDLKGVHWGIIIMVISIIVDVSRSRMLKKAAKQHGSQALEADALHFSTDVWSSSVVIAGLVSVWTGELFNIKFLEYADPIAALGVAVIVIFVSAKLGKATIDVLLDTAPRGMKEKIEEKISNIAGVLKITDIRIRPSGAIQYINVNIGIDPNQSHRNVHNIVHEIRERVSELVPRSDIMISTFPVDESIVDSGISGTLEQIIYRFPNCGNIHNIHVYEVEGKKKITVHIELNENLTLKESHELSHEIEKAVKDEITDTNDVDIYFEHSENIVQTEDITETRQDVVSLIKDAVDKLSDNAECHDIKLYKNGDSFSTFLHCNVKGDFTIDKLENMRHSINGELAKIGADLENIHIHFEPFEE